MGPVESTLNQWRELPVAYVPIGEIGTDEGLQSRVLSLANYADRRRLTTASEDHIQRMRMDLSANPTKDMEPLLVGSIDGNLYVIDGHHRLQAYRLARRSVVPVRTRTTSMLEAAVVSKLANCDGAKLPMHKQQAYDAAWQYLAHVTGRGRLPRPAQLSYRAIAGKFGISHATAKRMFEKLPQVKLEDFTEEACDPITGWPRWQQVRGNAWRDLYSDVGIDVRMQHAAERLAMRAGALFEKAGPEVTLMAVSLMRAQAEDGRYDALADWVSAEESDVEDEHSDY
jgi:ParB-like chromosome segregation protein Spo0J